MVQHEDIDHTGVPGVGGSGGTELDYVQATADVTISGTTEGTANTLLTGTSQAYAAVATLIEVFIPRLDLQANAGGNLVIILLYDGATLIGRLGVMSFPTNAAWITSFHGAYRLTPTAATHQYIVKATRSNANVVAELGTGGTGDQLPAFLRITTA